MSGLLVNGLVKAGESCPYEEQCGDFKNMACNGEGCPVSRGHTNSVDFSCGLARALAICNKEAKP